MSSRIHAARANRLAETDRGAMGAAPDRLPLLRAVATALTPSVPPRATVKPVADEVLGSGPAAQRTLGETHLHHRIRASLAGLFTPTARRRGATKPIPFCLPSEASDFSAV